jgi:O-antigen/teichoic acid export membrane protein
LAGSVTAGRLAAVLAVIMPLFLIPQAASILTFADVARAAGQDASSQVRLMCRVAGWAAAATVSGCCLFAHELVRILLGSRYGTEATDFTILILCVTPQILALPIGNALAAEGRVALTASLSIASFVVMLVGLAFLVPNHQALGGAIAFGLSMLAGGTCLIVAGYKRFGLGFWEIAGGPTGVALGGIAVTLNRSPLLLRIAGLLLCLATAGFGAARRQRHSARVDIGPIETH